MNLVVLIGTIGQRLGKRTSRGTTLTTLELDVEEPGRPDRKVAVTVLGNQPEPNGTRVIVVGHFARRWGPLPEVNAEHCAALHTASAEWALAEATARITDRRGALLCRT